MSGDRTEKPTPKKRRDVRKKGQVARSQELSHAIALVGAAAVLPIVIPNVNRALTDNWEQSLAQAASIEPRAAVSLLGSFMLDAGLALLPLAAVIGVAGVVAGSAMAGSRPNPNLLRPQFKKLNPKSGIQRIAGKQALWEFGRNTAKLALVLAVGFGVWQTGMKRLLSEPGADLPSMLRVIAVSVRDLLWRVALLGVVVGLADAAWNKRRHLKKTLQMTKQEVKDEHKQTEGDQHVKSAIRQQMTKLSRSRMIAAVADADVVLTNPTHLAVALKYEQGEMAPTCVAKGAGSIAQRIREEAYEHGVPVLERKPLARALFRAVDVGDAIPVTFYRAVAEILALVYRTRRKVAS